jgi:ATP-binding cassette subfamily E protein 1
LLLPDYFTKLLEDDLKAVVKPQYVDQIPKALRAGMDKSVKALIEGRLSLDNLDEVLDVLGTVHPSPSHLWATRSLPGFPLVWKS